MTTYTKKPLQQFRARQVMNGWVIDIDGAPGGYGDQFVFASLPELADWLAVQVTTDADCGAA